MKRFTVEISDEHFHQLWKDISLNGRLALNPSEIIERVLSEGFQSLGTGSMNFAIGELVCSPGYLDGGAQ